MFLNPSLQMQMLLIQAVLLFVGATTPQFVYNTTEPSHLAYFVADIATASFSPDKILLVSSNKYDDAVDMLLKNLHQHALWHLHVSRNGDLTPRPLKEQDDKVGSYVIFTTGADDVASQAQRLMESTSWNNRAPFLVLVGIPTATPEQLARSVLKELWENARVFNIVILVEHDTLLCLYTWFPYVQQEQCGEVREVALLNALSETDTRNFTTNTNLFSYKVPHNFWGCPIRVSSMFKKSTSEKLISNFLLRLNFTVLHRQTLDESLDYETILIDVMYDFGLGNSDIAAPVVLHKDLIKAGDPSHDMEWIENAWYVPCAKPLNRIQKVATIFSVSLWVALIALLPSVGIITWLLARLSTEDGTYKDISTALYNAWAVVVGVCVTKMPRTYHVRIVIFAWICYCLSINTVFQTFFTTFLVDPGLQKQITTLHEVSQSNMECGVTPGLRHLYGVKDALVNMIDKGHECKDFAACVERITDTGNFAVFEDSRKVKRYLASVKKRNSVCVMNNIDVRLDRMVALFSRRTLILEQFNKFVTRMLESGEITKHDREHWTLSTYFHDEEITSGEYFVFTISHLLVAFYALIIGHSVGCVMFLLELLHHSYSTYRQRSVRRTITERLS
ncbi:hypothetical protein Cfor_06395 [Coptotermes formosanus]|uniref:Ionotropic glutamate receptor C-terminal domain-containing protein n=1 Tax=Coptotermes formosanus TaxID=36987 RepID=A0A6L2PZ80_COPFO|nr:hypothetical protein Cfor_06395 [Coptotermes formosanus]